MTQPSPDVARDQHAFDLKLVELAQRYDLIVGAVLPFQSLGLNAQPMYTMDETPVAIRQAPAGRFNFGRSENRSPPTRTTVTPTGPDGMPRGTQALTFYDQATLINLPGHASAVAMSMHAIVSHVLDLLEHVAAPGPNWETGVTMYYAEPDAELNGMQWGNLYRGAHGEPRVRLLPYQGDGPIRGLADADVLVAIPAGGDTLPARSAVRPLRLGRVNPPASQRSDAPAAADAVSPPPPAATGANASAAGADVVVGIRETWKQLDDWFAADATRLPGELNGPASDDEIAALHAALGPTLPDELVGSLRIHDGQAEPGVAFVENDVLLGTAEIAAQWSIWRGLVAAGDFDGITSEPDAGIRDDWYNLKWILFTHDGSGNHLCVDLDPAEGGVVGQVIRVWHDDAVRERVARSFAQWLAGVAAGQRAS